MPSAYVLIICELGYEDQTVNILNTLVGIDATRLAGAYDIIAKVNAESTESLSRIIGLDIKKLDRIKSTLTLIVNERILNQNSQKILLQLILHRKLLNWGCTLVVKSTGLKYHFKLEGALTFKKEDPKGLLIIKD